MGQGYSRGHSAARVQMGVVEEVHMPPSDPGNTDKPERNRLRKGRFQREKHMTRDIWALQNH